MNSELEDEMVIVIFSYCKLLFFILGCWDCFHKCHKVGDIFTQGCMTTECMPGGFTKTIDNRKLTC